METRMGLVALGIHTWYRSDALTGVVLMPWMGRVAPLVLLGRGLFCCDIPFEH